MKPKKYPYSGRAKLTRKELHRLVKIGNIALRQDFIKNIMGLRKENDCITVIIYREYKPFFSYEEKTMRVRLNFDKVVDILNQY